MRSFPFLSLVLLALAGAVALLPSLLVQLALDALYSYRVIATSLTSLSCAALAVSAWRAQTASRRAVASGGFLLAVALSAFAVPRAWPAYETVPFAFVSDGATLRGTLMLPRQRGPVPVAIIAHGSPPVPRRFYTVWAEQIVRAGFAALTFDKRGTGESEGRLDPENNSGSEVLTRLGLDLAAAADALARDARIDRSRIVFVGLSQAGWTVPVAVSHTANVAGFLLLSGPTSTTAEERVFSDATGERAGDDWGRMRPRADALVEQTRPAGFDPVPLLRSSNVPGYWVFGSRDASIPVTRSIDILDGLIAEGRPYRYEVIDGADHLLLTRAGAIPDFDPRLWLALRRELGVFGRSSGR